MAGKDGTGPLGAGSMTGRRMGFVLQPLRRVLPAGLMVWGAVWDLEETQDDAAVLAGQVL
jgi:hypothetical protein